MTCRTTFCNPSNLREGILLNQILQVFNPILDAHNDNLFYIRMVLKFFKCMDNDWLSFYLYKLFRHLRLHPFANPAGKQNHVVLHIYNLMMYIQV